MGLFDIFASDPSFEWPLQRHVKPVIDLRTMEIGGVKVGDDADALRKFGKPDQAKPFKEEAFTYASLGFEFTIDNRRIAGLEVATNVDDEDLDELKPTDLDLICADGQTICVGRETTLSDVARVLGNAEADSEDGILDVNYVIDGHVLEFLANSSGQIFRVYFMKDN